MSVLLPLALAAIMTTDPLGYECIPEDRLEVAFTVPTKGARLPRTCIDDPCSETLSEPTLASYLGYRDNALYNHYRNRMTSVCGAPTQWDEKGIDHAALLWAVFDGGSGQIASTNDQEVYSNPVPASFLLLATAAAGLMTLRRSKG